MAFAMRSRRVGSLCLTMYTFYPFRSDGASPGFLAVEFASDAQARRHVIEVLHEHPTCAYVVCYEGARQVFTERRVGLSAAA